mmetsp:Transcript_42945/g.107472  ORF Transcript_42945/g.107472 Transcript_42945/m.107472 type:complete len:122 (+) Transcript_42945:128-493(+)
MPASVSKKYGKAGPPPTKPAPTLGDIKKKQRLATAFKALKHDKKAADDSAVDKAEFAKLAMLASDCNAAILRADARGGHTTPLNVREELVSSLLSFVTATRDEMLEALAKGGEGGKAEPQP